MSRQKMSPVVPDASLVRQEPGQQGQGEEPERGATDQATADIGQDVQERKGAAPQTAPRRRGMHDIDAPAAQTGMIERVETARHVKHIVHGRAGTDVPHIMCLWITTAGGEMHAGTGVII